MLPKYTRGIQYEQVYNYYLYNAFYLLFINKGRKIPAACLILPEKQM